MSCTLKNMSGSPGSIQYCAVSYNTSCKLTVQLNSDKYDVFYDLIIQLHVTTLKKIAILGVFELKFPISGQCVIVPKL